MSTAFAPIKVELIDPKIHQKFSPNLFKYLRRDRRKRGSFFNESTFYRRDGDLFFGILHDGDFIGNRVWPILCRGLKEHGWCFACEGDLFMEDPAFFASYLKIGRCALDPEHTMSFLNSDSRYTATGDCTWCGGKESP